MATEQITITVKEETIWVSVYWKAYIWYCKLYAIGKYKQAIRNYCIFNFIQDSKLYYLYRFFFS